MAQSAISFSVLVSKYSFHIIDFDIGFEINACQPEILISNLNEQFRTALAAWHLDKTRLYCAKSETIAYLILQC